MSKRKNIENDNYNNWTYKLLKEELGKRKLKKSGRKAELIQRLINDDGIAFARGICNKRKSSNLNNRNDLTSSAARSALDKNGHNNNLTFEEFKLKLLFAEDPEERARLFMSYHNYNIIYVIKVNNSPEKYRYFTLINNQRSFICGYCGSKSTIYQPKIYKKFTSCPYGEFYGCETYNRGKYLCQYNDPKSNKTACKIQCEQFNDLLKLNNFIEISKEEEEKVGDIQEETKEEEHEYIPDLDNKIEMQNQITELKTVVTQQSSKIKNLEIRLHQVEEFLTSNFKNYPKIKDI